MTLVKVSNRLTSFESGFILSHALNKVRGEGVVENNSYCDCRFLLWLDNHGVPAETLSFVDKLFQLPMQLIFCITGNSEKYKF